MCTKSHDSVSLLRKKFTCIFSVPLNRYTSTWYAVFKCTCMFKCVCVVFFYHNEVASELISFKLEVLFTFTCSIICFYGCDTYTFIKPI